MVSPSAPSSRSSSRSSSVAPAADALSLDTLPSAPDSAVSGTADACQLAGLDAGVSAGDACDDGSSSMPRIHSQPGLRFRSASVSATAGHNDPPLFSHISVGRFRRWCTALCVVTFDLNTGPELEFLYPNLALSEAEVKTICFTSFPDSNSTSHTGDTSFSFRLRTGMGLTAHQRKLQTAGATVTSVAEPFDEHAPCVVDTDGYTYGYAYFRQARDARISRGYFQKSVVVLTPLANAHGLFLRVLREGGVGERVMDALVAEAGDDGVGILAKTVLSKFCTEISNWATPISSVTCRSLYEAQTMQLSVMGSRMLFSVAPTTRFAQFYNVQTHDSLVAHVAAPCPLYSTFAANPALAYTLWELMLLAEPVLVKASTPRGCSHVVQAIVEMIKPLPYGGDFRPFFTVMDADLTAVVGGIGSSGGSNNASATVLGVTNPYFDKLLAHWPNKVVVGRMSSGGAVKKAESSPSLPFAPARSPMGRGMPIVPPGHSKNGSATNENSPKVPSKSFLWGRAGPSSSPASESPTGSPRQANAGIVTGRGSRIVVFDAVVEALHTKHKNVLSKDRKFLKSLEEMFSSVTNGATSVSLETLENTFRRHFVELSDKFLQPLNRHYDGLVVGSPRSMTLSALRAKPEIKPFRQDTFLESLKTSPPDLPVKSKKLLIDLYARFLKSPNFAAWLQQRSAEVNRDWRAQYTSVLVDADVVAWMREKGRREVECVDLMLRLKDEVARYGTFFRGDQDFECQDVEEGYLPSIEQYQKLKLQKERAVAEIQDRVSLFK
ncbi:hypothetical protein HDU84_000757 [Entophlyctis sp. JEL0112]|nr:hypothetical protein HDU84_000757 [Entophlyctis sp. JEL0112]